MSKRSLLISIIIIAMTLMLVSSADALNCRRCRSLPGICLDQLYERIKVTWKTQKTAEFTAEALQAAFTGWCNPSGGDGACKYLEDIIEPGFNPFFNVDFGTTSFFAISEDDLIKGKDVLAETKIFNCELRDIWLCTVPLDLMTYTEEGEDFNVKVCNGPLDPSRIPPEAYWDEGQVGKWTYLELYCPYPWYNSNLIEEGAGDILIGALWVKTYVQEIICDKDGCVDGDLVLGEEGCFLLDTESADTDDWQYYFSPVSKENCKQPTS